MADNGIKAGEAVEVLVSVIMPAWNCAGTIGKAIDSVLVQDVQLELIVVNDTSPDDLDAVMKTYASDPRVRYVKNEHNLGASGSRNRGVALAKGSYVAFLDADDWWEKGKLKKQMQLLTATQAVLCSTGRELLTPDGRQTGRVIGVPEEITYRKLLHHNCINCSSVVLRTDVAREFPMRARRQSRGLHTLAAHFEKVWTGSGCERAAAQISSEQQRKVRKQASVGADDLPRVSLRRNEPVAVACLLLYVCGEWRVEICAGLLSHLHASGVCATIKNKTKRRKPMIQKLIANIKKTNAPIVVGLDPMLSYIPEQVKAAAFKEYGETLEGAAEAVWQYNKAIVDEVYDLIPAVKPQIAMYEQFGIPGLTAFKRTVDYCHEKGLVVIGDVKRGDIGSTSAAYATAHLGQVQIGAAMATPFGEDFATVNPYLGSDGIKPFLEVCKAEKKGLFILVKTSNPSSGEFQDQLINGRPLYELVGEKVAEWGAECMGDEYSYVGAVVGATYPEMGKVLRKVMPKSFILVPGYGAQGGKAADLVHYFNEDGLGAIVNSSRGIIAAYKQEKYAAYGAENFAKASRAAVEDMIADINGALERR